MPTTASPTPERVVTPRGDEHWLLPDGKLHRTDGPAWTVFDGSELWYRHGLLHRTDGPAHTFADGSTFEWYVNGSLVADRTDKSRLAHLRDAGDIGTITHVLSVWQPDGPTVVELVSAVNAARFPAGAPS